LAESDKILALNDFNTIKEGLKNKKIVLVGGCFDIFHYGHLSFLKKAKASGDFLIVALESDEFIIKKKQRRPIHNQKQRAEILAALSMVDLILILPYISSDKGYFDLVKFIKPNIIAISDKDVQYNNKKKQAELIKGEVKIVSPLNNNFSTKKIINIYKI